MIRKAQFAGSWYPDTAAELAGLFESYAARIAGRDTARSRAIGLMAPHAGYVYSGMTAYRTYAAVEIPASVIVLGIQHRAFVRVNGVYPEGAWETPLGAAEIDDRLAQALLDAVPELERDASAHAGEHSLELQIPFLRHFRPDVKICPVSIAEREPSALIAIGKKIARAIEDGKDEILIAASSDMTHFETEEVARRQDEAAIERILKLDPEGLYATVVERDITMCGAAPATVMLAAAVELGARKAELVEYTSSAAVSGDTSSVVGYAGVVVR